MKRNSVIAVLAGSLGLAALGAKAGVWIFDSGGNVAITDQAPVFVRIGLDGYRFFGCDAFYLAVAPPDSPTVQSICRD